MNEQHARELFLEHHRGSLAAADEAELRAFLVAHPALQREFEEFAVTLKALDTMPAPTPSSRLRAHLLAAIEQEKRAAHEILAPVPVVSRTASTRLPRQSAWVWLLRSALACVLLAIGYFVGTRNVPVAKPAEELASVGERTTQSEIADLRRQLQALNQLVDQSLLQQPQPATSDRLKAVLASGAVQNPTDKVIKELIGSLALDPSANVRLSALEALYPHADQEVVRASVLTALPREQSPLVQVAMIDFLAAARDPAAAPALDRISRSEIMDQNVRAAAMLALNQF